MRRIRLMMGALVFSTLLQWGPAQGQSLRASGTLRASPVTPAMQCRTAIESVEQTVKTPGHLLAAIGRVESGRWDAQSGTLQPWPWIINVEGEDSIFETKAQAVAAVRTLQAHGVSSIDVGCMQVNLMYHPNAFVSLEQAFDPLANVRYAAHFLTQLFERTNDWTQATAFYHSATPDLGAGYLRRVLAVWPEEIRIQELRMQAERDRSNLAGAWAATLPGKPRPIEASLFRQPHAQPRDASPLPLKDAKRVDLKLAAWRGGVLSGQTRPHASD